MAHKVEIEVEISATGEVHLKVNGVKGTGCLDLARAFEEATGEVVERTLSGDYYQKEQAFQVGRSK